MLPIEPLGLSANQWQFLSGPDRYVEASMRSDRKLVLESTRRQFLTARDILARLNGSCGEKPRRGILLADDVGLGKTTVAALVAWVMASAGERRGVRILAPNDVMMRRWEEELLSHIPMLQECAPALQVRAKQIKARKGNLLAGTIQIVKHSYAASDHNLKCDLLIIDEAHRAKGENTAFSCALKKQKKHASRILILTATPFSIRLDELQRMLALIGADDTRAPVNAFGRALDDLYSGSAARSAEVVAERLAAKARAAVEALGSFVIRHGIDGLPREQTSFGGRKDWDIEVKPARPEELELLVRMDRSLRVAKGSGAESTKATNDPRFHVGWRHFDEVRKGLKRAATDLAEPAKAVVEHQIKCMKRLRRKVGVHSKMSAVAKEVDSTIKDGEKVVLFCHHHATAQELTVHLASILPKNETSGLPHKSVWRKAWREALTPGGEWANEATLREAFIEWLCADLIRTQTWSWLQAYSRRGSSLLEGIRTTRARHLQGPEAIAEAAQRLYHALLQSKSSRAVLKEAEDRPELLPGANGGSRVLGVCMPSDAAVEESLFIHNQQPDTVISIFNSPFGPDVLVVTDRLSEGIDLHRYCRHLIHYELDPSPIRTVQRNGRLRRVNSWAAATGQDILYAYPAFRGTRDHRLVKIMEKRINSFSLLLGGVQDFDVEEVVGSEEFWRNQVIKHAKTRLAAAGRLLRARRPGA
jgi:ERCC4-related helicase